MPVVFGGFFRFSVVRFPEEFWPFLEFLVADELNHYHGLVKLMDLLGGYKIPKDELRQKPDFRLIGEVATTALSWLCLLAYDEYVTLKGYGADLVAVYKRLGPVARSWKGLVIRDEHNHYRNAVALLRRYFLGQQQEIERILQAWVDFELRDPHYQGTFVFNRGNMVISESFLRTCATKVWQEVIFDK